MPCKWSGAAALLALLPMVPADWYWQDYWGALWISDGAGWAGFLSSNSASFPFSGLWAIFCDCLNFWPLQKLVFEFLQYSFALVGLVLCFSLHSESCFCGFTVTGFCIWMNFSQNSAVCLPGSYSLSPQIPFVLAVDSLMSINIQVLVLYKSIPEVWKVVQL